MSDIARWALFLKNVELDFCFYEDEINIFFSLIPPIICKTKNSVHLYMSNIRRL